MYRIDAFFNTVKNLMMIVIMGGFLYAILAPPEPVVPQPVIPGVKTIPIIPDNRPLYELFLL